MGLFIAPLMLIACVLYVAMPLLRENLNVDEVLGHEASERERLGALKSQLIANIKDIEMDYRMQKLSDEDYRRLKGEFEERALEVLKKLDQMGLKADSADS